MDIYLDLSIIAAAAIHICALLYTKMMLPLKGKKINYIFLIIFMVIPVFSLPFFTVKTWVFYFSYYLLILFSFLPRDDKFKAILLYAIAFFILLSSACLINSGIDHYHLVPLIHTPVATLSLLLLPLPYLAFFLISFILKKRLLFYHFIYNVNIKYKEQLYVMKGYLDSGNTLLYQGMPVIFIKSTALRNIELESPTQISYKTVDQGIQTESGYQGIICLCKFFKKHYQHIYFTVVDGNHSFNNCDCLLNAHLL